MECTAFKEVAGTHRSARCDLPFRLRRQPCVRPAREGLGFEEAQMTHWRMGIHGHQPMEREGMPLAIATLPILRCPPTVSGHGVPSGRKPQFGPLIAAIVDELD